MSVNLKWTSYVYTPHPSWCIWYSQNIGLFIINYRPQVLKWLFNGLQGWDVAMKHSNKHLRRYIPEAGAECVCSCVCNPVKAMSLALPQDRGAPVTWEDIENGQVCVRESERNRQRQVLFPIFKCMVVVNSSFVLWSRDIDMLHSSTAAGQKLLATCVSKNSVTQPI